MVTTTRKGGAANRVDSRGWQVRDRFGKPVELPPTPKREPVENSFNTFRDALAQITRAGKLGEWFAVAG